MEPNNDLQEQALEIPPEKAPLRSAPDHPGKNAENSGAEVLETGTPRPRLLRRLLAAGEWPLRHIKRTLRTGAMWLVDAGRRIWQRLRKRTETSRQEEDADDRHGKVADEDTRPARKKPAPPPAAEEIKPAAPRSRVRSFFLYLLVLIVGGIAGMTFSFALLSKMIANQAQRISDQRDEIAQVETQLSRVQEAEAKSRLEGLEYQKKLAAAESRLQSLANDMEKAKPAQSSGNNPVVPAKPPVPGKSANCTLEPGKIGDNLTRCIDEFNRK